MSVCCTNTVRTPLMLSAIWSLNAVGSGLDFGFLTGKSGSNEKSMTHDTHDARRPIRNMQRISLSDEYEELAAVYEPKAFMCMKENLAVALELRESLKCIKVFD